MKNQIFSGKLYWQSIKKVRTLGIAMAIVIVLLNMFLPIMGIMENSRINIGSEFVYDSTLDAFVEIEVDREPGIEKISDINFAPFLWAVIVFAPLMVFAMFSFLNERKQSDFYHSLPQTRLCVYTSMIAAIFTWLAGVTLASVTVNAILWSMAKYYSFTFMTVLSNFVLFLVLSIFVAGFMAVAMMITGTPTSNILLFFFLALAPRYFVLLFINAVAEVTPIFVDTSNILSILSFERYLPLSWGMNQISDSFFADPGMLIYSAVVGILLFLAAGVLYHFRRSESANKSAPNHVMQHVFRSAFTFAAAVTIPVSLIMDGFEEYVLLLFLLVIIVHVIYELMTTKKIKKMVKSLPFLVVPAILSLIFAGTVYGTSAYLYSVRPDAEDIQSVTFIGYDYSTYGDIKIVGKELTSPEIIEIVTDALHGTLDRRDRGYVTSDENGVSYDWRSVAIRLESGRTIKRRVQFPMETKNQIRLAMETKDIFLSVPTWEEMDYFEFSPYNSDNRIYLGDDRERYQDSIYKQIWDAFTEDFNALSDKEKYNLVTFLGSNRNEYKWNDYYVAIRLLINDGYSRVYRSTYYPITPELTPKTLELIESLYGDQEKRLSVLQSIKEKELGGEVKILHINEKGFAESSTVTEKTFFEAVSLDDRLFNGSDKKYMVNFYSCDVTFWLSLSEIDLEVLGKNVIE